MTMVYLSHDMFHFLIFTLITWVNRYCILWPFPFSKPFSEEIKFFTWSMKTIMKFSVDLNTDRVFMSILFHPQCSKLIFCDFAFWNLFTFYGIVCSIKLKFFFLRFVNISFLSPCTMIT